MFKSKLKLSNSAESICTILPLNQCLAKSRKTNLNTILPGRLVLSHCHVVGEVARAMILRMPAWLRKDLFQDGSE